MNTEPAGNPPNVTDTGVLQRALERERLRRQKAEALLEERSRELFEASESLRQALADLQRNQRQLVQQEKLASLGVLSAGVAHEINNPIGFVSSNVNTLSDYLRTYQEGFELARTLLTGESGRSDSSPTPDRSWLDWERQIDLEFLLGDTNDLLRETLEGLERVKTIVSGLKNFARADDNRQEPVDINESVRTALTMARNQLKYQCEVVEELREVPPVLGNASRLSQVVLNLLVNAAQAASENCWIRISTDSDGRDVTITVEDNGCGIAPENLDRVFTPFFTTKPVGVGTGLGLSISHGIIADHGGSIDVNSEPGVGTCFTIRLPVAPDSTRKPAL